MKSKFVKTLLVSSLVAAIALVAVMTRTIINQQILRQKTQDL